VYGLDMSLSYSVSTVTSPYSHNAAVTTAPLLLIIIFTSPLAHPRSQV
jgi:hypothetical protein